MKIRRDRGNPSLGSKNIKRNRILGIESSGGSGKSSRKLIYTLLLVTVALLAILVIVKLLYKKPGSFIDTTKSDFINNIISPKEEKKREPSTSQNAQLQKAIDDYVKGYTANAITGFNSVVESDAPLKDKGQALLYLGIISHGKGNYKEALEFFDRGLKYDGGNPLLYLNRAKTFRAMKDFDRAIIDAEKARSMEQSSEASTMLGNIHFEKGNFDRALEYYREILEKDKNNATIMYNMAITLFKKGDRFAALEYLKKAAASAQIGDIAFKANSRLGSEFLGSNMLDQSEHYLRKAIELNPQDPAVRYNLSLLHLKRGKKQEALEELQRAEKLGRDNIQLLEGIGEAYSSLGDYNKSIGVYEKILEGNRQNIAILSRVGELYYKQGRLENALNSFKKITQVEPTGENARVSYLNMGNIFDDLGKFDDAIKAYKSALAIKPLDDQTYYNMGIAYLNAKKPELAITAWKKALELNPNNLKAQLSMGDFYLKKGHRDMAEKTYQDIIQKWKDNEEALFKLGTIYQRENNYRDAENAYRQIIALNKKSDFTKNAYVNLAMILAGQSKSEADQDSSINLIKKALLISPGDSDALMALGIVYAKKNIHEKAIETFYQVIKSTRDNAKIGESYNNIGKSYYKLKKYSKAIEAFTRGVEASPTNEEMRMNRKAAVQAYEKELARIRK